MDHAMSALSHGGQWIVMCVLSRGSGCVYVL